EFCANVRLRVLHIDSATETSDRNSFDRHDKSIPTGRERDHRVGDAGYVLRRNDFRGRAETRPRAADKPTLSADARKSDIEIAFHNRRRLQTARAFEFLRLVA